MLDQQALFWVAVAALMVLLFVAMVMFHDVRRRRIPAHRLQPPSKLKKLTGRPPNHKELPSWPGWGL